MLLLVIVQSPSATPSTPNQTHTGTQKFFLVDLGAYSGLSSRLTHWLRYLYWSGVLSAGTWAHLVLALLHM